MDNLFNIYIKGSMMTLPFTLPPVIKNGLNPIWEGNGFRIGHEFFNVLQYGTNHAGWNDDLTAFHEESAGDHHFIDRASRDHTISQLKKNVRTLTPVILEVGCSSGFMLQRITKNFPQATVMGADIVHEPLIKLSKLIPQVPLLRLDMLQCPLPDSCIDAIVMLNVLEHIEDDARVLNQVYRILKPGGVVVIEVPAGPHLYDVYDKVLLHYRRYTLSRLRMLMQKQNFKIKNQSHLGFFLYPGFWFVKKRNKHLLLASESVQREFVDKTIRDSGENKLFHAIMQCELRLGHLISYPFGIRCLMTAIK